MPFLPFLFPFGVPPAKGDPLFLQPWVSDNVILCTNFIFFRVCRLPSWVQPADVGYPKPWRRLPYHRCRLPYPRCVGYPILDVGCTINVGFTLDEMLVTLCVGYPLRCWLPSDVGYPVCWLPSVLVTLSDVGYPLMLVTLSDVGYPMDVGYPLWCRLPPWMSVTL